MRREGKGKGGDKSGEDVRGLSWLRRRNDEMRRKKGLNRRRGRRNGDGVTGGEG